MSEISLAFMKTSIDYALKHPQVKDDLKKLPHPTRKKVIEENRRKTKLLNKGFVFVDDWNKKAIFADDLLATNRCSHLTIPPYT